MIARAPGKLVLSGAYSVLEGAPALVAAVDRYAVADASRPADLITAEVRAAIAAGHLRDAPWFDASALRAASPSGGPSRKLGLGSSAAILVASLASLASPAPLASLAATAPPDAALPLDSLFDQALAAHRAAQGGGSGVDVAASVFGGVLACRLDPDGRLTAEPHALPEGTVIEVFSSSTSAETRSLLAAVRAFRAREPAAYRALLDRASSAAAAALTSTTPGDLARAVALQARALGELGRLAGAPILPPEIETLAAAAALEGGTVSPSGAGGGDVSIFIGPAPASGAILKLAADLGLERIDLRIGARGVHHVHRAPSA
jgi:phosphomevalonate kinase